MQPDWYLTLDEIPVVDAITESPLMTLDNALYLKYDLEVCHPNSAVVLWKGREV